MERDLASRWRAVPRKVCVTIFGRQRDVAVSAKLSAIVRIPDDLASETRSNVRTRREGSRGLRISIGGVCRHANF